MIVQRAEHTWHRRKSFDDIDTNGLPMIDDEIYIYAVEATVNGEPHAFSVRHDWSDWLSVEENFDEWVTRDVIDPVEDDFKRADKYDLLTGLIADVRWDVYLSDGTQISLWTDVIVEPLEPACHRRDSHDHEWIYVRDGTIRVCPHCGVSAVLKLDKNSNETVLRYSDEHMDIAAREAVERGIDPASEVYALRAWLWEAICRTGVRYQDAMNLWHKRALYG